LRLAFYAWQIDAVTINIVDQVLSRLSTFNLKMSTNKSSKKSKGAKPVSKALQQHLQDYQDASSSRKNKKRSQNSGNNKADSDNEADSRKSRRRSDSGASNDADNDEESLNDGSGFVVHDTTSVGADNEDVIEDSPVESEDENPPKDEEKNREDVDQHSPSESLNDDNDDGVNLPHNSNNQSPDYNSVEYQKVNLGNATISTLPENAFLSTDNVTVSKDLASQAEINAVSSHMMNVLEQTKRTSDLMFALTQLFDKGYWKSGEFERNKSALNVCLYQTKLMLR
jgi:hypothetical protein